MKKQISNSIYEKYSFNHVPDLVKRSQCTIQPEEHVYTESQILNDTKSFHLKLWLGMKNLL